MKAVNISLESTAKDEKFHFEEGVRDVQSVLCKLGGKKMKNLCQFTECFLLNVVAESLKLR